MPQLPDPNKYNDPIKYFRDSHALITTQVNLLEKLTHSAELKGVIKSITEDKEWAEILDFFVNTATRHEIDEELALFPYMLDKIPHVGFQQSSTPIRFIHEQHESMLLRATELLRIWKQTLAQKEITNDEATQFIIGARELVTNFREHMRRENELIYTTANDELLSPSDRQKILEIIRENNSKEVMSDYLAYDQPTYSLTGYSPIIVNKNEDGDAVSTESLDIEEDEEEGEEEDNH
jgi:hemerythrin-like domain-containing protein